MNTIITSIDKDNIDNEKIDIHANILRNGGTVIFPTETVYGLGANALDEEATKKIFKAKGRPSDNPLIVHIADKNDVYKLAKNVNESAKIIMDKFWPGPITIILQKSDILPATTTAGLDTVAIRMPSHPIALRLIERANVPVAAPSANISGRPSPTQESHVLEEMNKKVEGIILGGDCSVGIESTVIDITNETPVILRPGKITYEDLLEAFLQVDIDPAILEKNENIVPRSPGMKYTHYSPKADVYIVKGEENKVIEKINKLILENKDKKIGVMCLEKNAHKYNAQVISLGKDINDVARNLFKTLREMDKRKIDIVYSESFDTKGLGQAVMNRLNKAAGYKIIHV
ncbi:L-threonylcarbamoyladenylate synthase [Alkalithermobacter thermoalcaliphilus JW-YL-7 = DSM 7308]|uniref:Threonylcarbamoyl-AMP synthase n=1 Tax=Alkalithermobacter thermoalcaliphilus JW-YL-7 = DSM 7308 TaxID=1121328 RepID=A0A150FSD6_CLOPD|nr:Sua5/YciO/YrdC/YwlC family protein [[Clostridium] paradoxum JW-YL-7 = DSM 7308]SHK71459.1 L-threonylcarbamoyladenylate synthase [[Clostridium] paradoxum JW-YL-7 = DSM 7308]